jgi:hypothetical protein
MIVPTVYIADVVRDRQPLVIRQRQVPVQTVQQPEDAPPLLLRLQLGGRLAPAVALVPPHAVVVLGVLAVQTQAVGEADGLAPPLVAVRLEVARGHADAEQDEGEDVLDGADGLVALGRVGKDVIQAEVKPTVVLNAEAP